MAYRKDKSIDVYCPETAEQLQVSRDRSHTAIATQKLASISQSRLLESTKALQERVLKLQFALQQSNSRAHRYHELFTLAPLPYISLDSHGRVLMVNLAATCLLDCPRSKLVNESFFSFVDSSERAVLMDLMDNASISSASSNTALTLSLPNRKKLTVLLAVSIIHTNDLTENTFQLMLIDDSLNQQNEKLWRNAKDYMEELALHDPLTKLPNRYKFNDSLDVAMNNCQANDTRLAVIYFDLDGFKTINDSQGHATGDAVLNSVATRLTDFLGSRENTARIGGDEFVVTVENVRNTAEVESIARELASIISQPITVGAKQVGVTTSMGICLYPDQASNSDELVSRADKAMYLAKQTKGNATVLYARGAISTTERQVNMQTALAQAIQNNELDLVYQPIHDLSTQRTTLVEALLRWHHPTLGHISPADFIPEAEQSDVICDIGCWVLDKACQQIQHWRSLGFELAVAVNVSARQLTQTGFIDIVQSSLQRYKLPAHLLELEITETALIAETDICRQTLQTLANMGHTISMDDFGTGQSSLARLVQLPVQRLKIDRSFTREIESSATSRSVIKAIMSMAKDLNLQVIAEGIETEAQKQFLCSVGCTKLQGFLLSNPQSAELTLNDINSLNNSLTG